MINQTDHYAGRDAEAPNGANSVDQLMSSGVVNGAVGHLRTMQARRPAVSPVPKSIRMADERALEAFVERRMKLAARIRAENPTRTEEEIEARLEQFGA